MGFSGWPPEAVEFFSGLQADNTKAYWTAHKAVYEESVREPMAELLRELSGEFGPRRSAAGAAGGPAQGGGARGRRRAGGQDRAARVPRRPSQDRTAPLPGPDLLAALAGGAVAAYGAGHRPRGGLPAHRGTGAPLAG